MSMIPFDNRDWFRKFFDWNNSGGIRGRPGSRFFDLDPFREFEEMERRMNDVFNQYEGIVKNPPKELIREYETSDGNKVREVGPLVYGYSMTIGPDGKPNVTEFGNIKHPATRYNNVGGIHRGWTGPQIMGEREPLADVSVTDKEVKVVIEIPGVKKDNIKINAINGGVEVSTSDPQRKYYRTVELPEEADIDSAKSTYNNGILEITFNKKKETKSKGKEIKID